jgi:hypothetical protein
MTIQVELSPGVEARLVAQAVERGIALEAYASQLLREASMLRSAGNGVLTSEELQAMLREVAEGSESLPKLPTSAFSRESFYDRRT